MNATSKKRLVFWKHALSLVLLLLLLQTGNEVYVNGFASGHWLGRLSSKWALTLAFYSLLASILFVAGTWGWIELHIGLLIGLAVLSLNRNLVVIFSAIGLDQDITLARELIQES